MSDTRIVLFLYPYVKCWVAGWPDMRKAKRDSNKLNTSLKLCPASESSPNEL